MALSVVCEIVDLALASIAPEVVPAADLLADPWAWPHPTVWAADGPFRGFMSLFGPGPQFTLAVDYGPMPRFGAAAAAESALASLASLPEMSATEKATEEMSDGAVDGGAATEEFAPKEPVATKEPKEPAATKEDEEPVATKEDEEPMATKAALAEGPNAKQPPPPPLPPLPPQQQQALASAAAPPGPRPTTLVRAKSLRVESAAAARRVSSARACVRGASPPTRRLLAGSQPAPQPTNPRGWETPRLAGRNRGRAISDGDERHQQGAANGAQPPPTPPRRWERVPSGGGDSEPEGAPEAAANDADGSLLSEEGGTRTISMDDLNAAYFQACSRDGGGGGEEDPAAEPLLLKVLRLEEENGVLKDVALRLEGDVSKLRNVIAATQGMALNTVQTTAYSSVPSFVLPLGVYHPSPGLETHSEVMSDDGSGMVWPPGNTNDRFALPHLTHSSGHLLRRHRRHLSTEGSGSVGGLLSSAAKRAPVSVPPIIPERSPVAPAGHQRARPTSTFASRLSVDLAKHVAWVDEEERRLRSVKEAAFLALQKEVQSLWPRAQVSVYGSFVTALGLPSSDLDLVISLPKVQSLPLAVGPGDLEGRNALKETWQQNLSRTLRSSSWVDPSSVKTITR
jgi:hypothetical protein